MQALLNTIASTDAPDQARRIFHGRGGLHPGCEHLALDFYSPVWLLTAFHSVDDETLESVGQALSDRWQRLGKTEPLTWVYQYRHEGRSDTRLMAGTVPEPHVVQEDGARYLVHVTRGKNHGLFLDMAAGRQWVREHAAGHTVLNLFAYTCAFSVAALQGGAHRVVNVDMSQGAIAIGQQNHALNGLQGRANFLAHDIFKTWGKVARSAPYGLVIVDPPSYQKGSFVATKDYQRLLRRLPELLAPGGRVLLCLNAPELAPDFLHNLVHEAAPDWVLEQRLPNPEAFADVSPDRALKVLVYRAP